MSSYFGSHSSGGGKIRVTNSSDLLAALKIQTIYNANQSNPKSKVRTAGHTNPAEMQVQFNSVAQQINYGVKHSQNFKPTITSAPSILTVTALNQSARIKWTSPSNIGGGAITGYVLKATPVSPSGADITQESMGAGHEYTFTGLTNGHTYKFSVAAINAAGLSDYSGYSRTITPVAGQPGAPTNVNVAIASATSIDVSWTAPSDTGGASITNYTIYGFENDAIFAMTPAKTKGSAGTSYTYTGLTTGNKYYFKVAAWTSATGGGPSTTRSQPSDDIVPCGATNQPGAPAGVAGDELVSLSWTAPSDLQGSRVAYYQIEVLNSAGASLVPARIDDTPNADRVYVVMGLDNGRGYKFKVRSLTTINSFVSAWGGNSTTVTPTNPVGGTTPTAPQNLAADYSGIDALVGGGVHLLWEAPSTGAPSRYVVSRKLNGTSFAYAPIKYVPGNVLECLINDGDIGLDGGTPIAIPNGTAYDYVVNAEKFTVEVPAGPYSDSVPFTAASLPTWNPLSGNVSVTKAEVGQLAVAWDAAVANGSDIQEYRLYASATTTPSASYVTLPPTPTSYTINFLAVQPTYIWLKAVNEVGASDYTDPAVVETPLDQPFGDTPIAPQITSVTNYKDSETGDLGAMITYVQNDMTMGSHVFTVTATRVSDGALLPSPVSPFIDIFPGLTAGESYTFTIHDTVTGSIINGVSSAESDPPSDPLLISDIPAQITDAPTIDSVGDGEVTISWVAPSSDAPIKEYFVDLLAVGIAYGTSFPAESTTATIRGLTNGKAYRFRVRARNDLTAIFAEQDYSPYSELAVPGIQGSTEIAPDTPADPPNGFAEDGSVSLNWTFNGSSGTANGAPVSIVGYNIYYREQGVGSYTLISTFPTDSIVVGVAGIGQGVLTNGTAYEFRYTVLNGNITENESGPSPATVIVPTVAQPGNLPTGPPNPPLTATYNETSYVGMPGYTLEWGAPSTGEPALSYTVKYNIKLADGSGSDYIYTYDGVHGQTLVLPASDIEFGIYQFSVQSVGDGGASEPVYSDVF